MNGLLVVNHFLNTQKFNILHNHLTACAKKMGIGLEIKTNLELATQGAEGDFALFWDKDINLARRLERQGMPVFNSSDSIALCDDKARTYVELDGIVPQPKTLIAPKFYCKSDLSEFVLSAVEIIGLPLVFKECFGSFAMQVHLCHSVQEILSFVSDKPFVLQEFVSESAGRDIRIEVVGEKCVSAVMRENKNDFRSNVTNGGKMEQYSPTEEEKRLALTACRALGLTFGGVDILMNSTVCEVNSNAHIINIMNCNNIDIAPLIFDEIRRQIK